MARNLDTILLIDLEASCWRGGPPKGQESEIIEIGAVAVNIHDLTIQEPMQIFVQNKCSTISDFCTDLTGITQETLDEQGIHFSEACKLMEKKLRSKHMSWGSWGNYDRQQFGRNCQLYGVEYPLGPTHFNVKDWFSIALGESRGYGVSTALDKLGWEFEGTPHCGADDAFNIARLFVWIMQRMRTGVTAERTAKLKERYAALGKD